MSQPTATPALLTLLLGLCCTVAFGQKPQTATKPKPAATTTKKALYIFRTSWGGYQGVQNVVSAQQIKAMLSQPLVITNPGNTVTFTFSSFRLAYTKLDHAEDEQTGASTTSTNMIGDRFTTSTLPELWQNNIAENIHKGETLYFYDVIVMDTQGRRFFAPDLKFTVE